MPWTEANFNSNTDNPKIGTAIVKFDDGDGFTFTFSERVDEPGGLSAFVNRAKQALAAKQNEASRLATINTKILNALNA